MDYISALLLNYVLGTCASDSQCRPLMKHLNDLPRQTDAQIAAISLKIENEACNMLVDKSRLVHKRPTEFSIIQCPPYGKKFY